MFNSVILIRDICKQRKIPIAKLEKDCGFANGYLNPKKLTKIPYDRALIIGEYLGMSPTFLMTGEDEKDTPAGVGERRISDDDLMFALWGDTDDIGEEDLEDVRRYAQFVRERKKEKK